MTKRNSRSIDPVHPDNVGMTDVDRWNDLRRSLVRYIRVWSKGFVASARRPGTTRTKEGRDADRGLVRLMAAMLRRTDAAIAAGNAMNACYYLAFLTSTLQRTSQRHRSIAVFRVHEPLVKLQKTRQRGGQVTNATRAAMAARRRPIVLDVAKSIAGRHRIGEAKTDWLLAKVASDSRLSPFACSASTVKDDLKAQKTTIGKLMKPARAKRSSTRR